jgi:hypothetical protein
MRKRWARFALALPTKDDSTMSPSDCTHSAEVRGGLTDGFHRYFEHLAPCGLLKQGTDPVQGIFRGGDPDEFVGPDAAKYISADMERSQYAQLVLESYGAEWTDAFSSNQREWRPALGSVWGAHPRPTDTVRVEYLYCSRGS